MEKLFKILYSFIKLMKNSFQKKIDYSYLRKYIFNTKIDNLITRQ